MREWINAKEDRMDYLLVNTRDIMDWDNDLAEYMALEIWEE